MSEPVYPHNFNTGNRTQPFVKNKREMFPAVLMTRTMESTGRLSAQRTNKQNYLNNKTRFSVGVSCAHAWLRIANLQRVVDA